MRRICKGIKTRFRFPISRLRRSGELEGKSEARPWLARLRTAGSGGEGRRSKREGKGTRDSKGCGKSRRLCLGNRESDAGRG